MRLVGADPNGIHVELAVRGSIFTLFRPQHAFATGEFEIARLLALLVIGAACATIGVVMFQRRDVIA